ncbi:MAG: DNA repair protein RecN [Oscillospiraceae bacterium]|nr:DNA repair protein RecN [Oscillospiraceae bacterium]
MLNELHIENIAVIERADMHFSAGLNVLTGETGAGKSIVIDSIGAVLGDRVSRDLVRRGAEKGLVSAVFDLEGCRDWLEENDIEAEDELILQRRITADGKSSCRICGTPVSAAQLKELAALLVDIHGQNDGRQLMDEHRHREYLDRFGVDPGCLADYAEAYRQFRSIRRELDALTMDEIEKERLSDSLRYQIEELERAELKAGEYDSLCSRRDLLRNAEKLTEALDSAVSLLSSEEDNAVSMTQNAAYYLGRASAYAAELEEIRGILDDAAFQLSDAVERLRDFREGLDFSPEEYDSLETRISLLSKLQRKYNRGEDALIEHLAACREKLDNIQYADERTAKLRRQLAEAELLCRKRAAALSAARHAAAKVLESRISEELRALNMPSVRFAVDFETLEGEPGFDAQGCDRIRFLMSANAGEAPGRISRIASGGELSRIMLAMKNVFAEKDPVPTLIFDEIDTGVSGIAAQRVGEKLYAVSLGKQVMCVTHLPQIAAMADSHYLIRKEERGGRTYTDVTALDRGGRKQELARLHGGENISDLTLASAEEQLEACERFKAAKQAEKRT